MIDFQKARTNMVDCQIRPSDVTDYGILDAFGSVPRELFVHQSQRSLAYIDEDILVADGEMPRYLMEPMAMAKLVQLADIEADAIVLDIGCATGYSSAILSRLCSSVIAVESDETLVELASETLSAQGYDNVAVVNAPLQAGCPSEGPFDAIFIGGAVDVVPEALGKQLKDGGRMVVVEGQGNTGEALIYVRDGEVLSGRTSFNCAVKPLPGFQREPAFEF